MDVSVVGAGSMGHGIAQVAGMAGHRVRVTDADETQLRRAVEAIESTLAEGVDRGKVTADERAETLDRIEPVPELAHAVADADVVVEAVPEELDLKREVFTSIEANAPADAIVATNTSSLSVTAIASALDRPERALGLHFFNPPHLMELVEVVVAERTAPEVREEAVAFVRGLDREPVVVRDTPGFASSRLGVTLGLEAVRMLEAGVADVEAIDAAMTLGYNHPMGPLELTDLVGLDVRLDVASYLREQLGERFRPPQLLRRKVRAGDLGKKTGRGFYVWEDGEAVEPVDR